MKIQYETKAYIINTDFSKYKKHHDSMLAEHKAAAYGEPWKKKIEKLQNGDKVFLYQSGVVLIIPNSRNEVNLIQSYAACTGLYLQE